MLQEGKGYTLTKQSHISYLTGSLVQCCCIAFSFHGLSAILLSHSHFFSIHPLHSLCSSTSIILVFFCIKSQKIFIHFPLSLWSYEHLSTKSSSPQRSLICFLHPWCIVSFLKHFLALPSSKSSLFSKDVSAVRSGVLLNMVKHRKEKEVWKWVRLWHSQI